MTKLSKIIVFAIFATRVVLQEAINLWDIIALGLLSSCLVFYENIHAFLEVTFGKKR